MGKHLVTINNYKIEKLLLYIKSREKSNLFFKSLLFYLKKEDENEIKKLVNPSFVEEFSKLLKEIKKEKKNEN